MPIENLLGLRSYRGLPAEPLRKFFFNVDLPDATRIPDAMIKSVSELPTWALSTVKQFQGRDMAQYPDKRTLDPFSIVFHETVDLRILKYFEAWYKRTLTDKGIYSLPGSYKRILTIEMINNANQSALRRRYEGVQPTKISGFGFDVSSDEMVQPTITFVAESYESL